MKEKGYRFYEFRGVFQLPRWVDLNEFTLMLVKLVEKVGGFIGGGFIEVDKNGKRVRHGEER